jgi:hypothetical protein
MITATGTHTAKCLRCGRTLHAASSIKASYGRWCHAKIRAAAITAAVRDFTSAQIEKARELISDGGLVPTKRPGVFRAVKSSGDGSYLSHSATCNCAAGLRSRNRCYHVAAVRIVMASGKVA